MSIIEIFGNNFEAGDLGPSTIVGSAAFNFFLIIALCVVVRDVGKRVPYFRSFLMEKFEELIVLMSFGSPQVGQRSHIFGSILFYVFFRPMLLKYEKSFIKRKIHFRYGKEF